MSIIWSWNRADEPQSANPGNEAAYIVPLPETPRVSTPTRPAGLSRWPYQPMSPGTQWSTQAVSPITPNLVKMPYAASPQGVASWWPYTANYGAFMPHLTAAPKPRRPKGEACRTLSSLSQSSEWTSTAYTTPETVTCPQSRLTSKTGWKSLFTRQRRVNVALFVGVLFAVVAIAALGIYIGVSKKVDAVTTTTRLPVDEKLTGSATLKGLAFFDGYNDSTSGNYRTLKEGFCKQINKVLHGGRLAQSYKTCNVTGFSPGSVIVLYVLVVIRPPGDIYKSLEVQLRDALNDELERPNSALRDYFDKLSTTVTFGDLRAINPSTTPMTRFSTSATTTTTAASAGTETLTTVTHELSNAGIHTSGNSGNTTPETTFETTKPSPEVTGDTAAGTTETGSTPARTTTSDRTTTGSTTAGSTSTGSTTAGSTSTGSTSAGSTTYISTTVGNTITESTAQATSTVTQSVTADTSAITRETSTTGVDACASQPCQNGGQCTRDNDGYLCDCPVCGCSRGGATSTCGLADDICVNKTQSIPHPYDCHNYIQCVNSRAVQRPCPEGLVFNPNVGACSYLAVTACAQPVVAVSTTVAVVTTSDTRNCSVVTCQNGGTCNDSPPGVRCLCPPTHTGNTCETEIISCAETVCEHGANCTDDSDGFHCDCPAGYSGRHCETEIDECASSPCQHASTCVDHVDGYTCLCGHHCGCANQASGPNCEKDPVTCDGFNHGDYIPDPDNCVLSHRCLRNLGTGRTQPGVANCTSGRVFVHENVACVDQAMCSNYTYFHP